MVTVLLVNEPISRLLSKGGKPVVCVALQILVARIELLRITVLHIIIETEWFCPTIFATLFVQRKMLQADSCLKLVIFGRQV